MTSELNDEITIFIFFYLLKVYVAAKCGFGTQEEEAGYESL